MLGKVAGRGAVTAFLIAAATVAGMPHATWCRAEAFESLARTLRAPLRQQRIGKVAIALHADGSDTTGEPNPVEVEALRRQLVGVCRDLSIGQTLVAATDDLPESMLGVAPEPADWVPVLKRENADAIVDVTWKSTKAGLVVRVALLNDRKVIWNGRARLRRKASTGAAALAGRSAGGANFMGPFAPNSLGGWPGFAWDATGKAGGGNSGLSGVGMGWTTTAGGASTGGETPADDLNARILEFASSHLGQTVGGGDCYELAVEALATVGAQPASAGNDFGQEVSLSGLLPGDILQFWSAKLVSPSLGVWQLGSPGHTAIVGDVQGTFVNVYHQNINGVRLVRQDVFDLSGLVSGQIIGYRAVAR